MHKTRKSVSKKFKITGSGKILRRTPGNRHFLRNKSARQRNRAGHDKAVSDGVARFVRQSIAGL